ncbi:MAG: DUF4160 domain-containing protein [Chloroflexi bacterium]|nr:DUF4160 domain-containing protein [Chloroflexota bacterium]MBI3340940.1 DUF4160 domain-containing protein [Chloroflexota bacterium]
MPEISRFFGISIKMFFGDHVPPHFHAEYGEYKAQVNIRSNVIIAGDLPPRVLGMVVEWASLHQDELHELWELAAQNKPLHRIEPLK